MITFIIVHLSVCSHRMSLLKFPRCHCSNPKEWAANQVVATVTGINILLNLCAVWCPACPRWSPRRVVGWACWPSPTTCGPPLSLWWSASCSSSLSNLVLGRRWRATGSEVGPSWPRPTPYSTSSGEREEGSLCCRAAAPVVRQLWEIR